MKINGYRNADGHVVLASVNDNQIIRPINGSYWLTERTLTGFEDEALRHNLWIPGLYVTWISNPNNPGYNRPRFKEDVRVGLIMPETLNCTSDNHPTPFLTNLGHRRIVGVVSPKLMQGSEPVSAIVLGLEIPAMTGLGSYYKDIVNEEELIVYPLLKYTDPDDKAICICIKFDSLNTSEPCKIVWRVLPNTAINPSYFPEDSNINCYMESFSSISGNGDSTYYLAQQALASADQAILVAENTRSAVESLDYTNLVSI